MSLTDSPLDLPKPSETDPASSRIKPLDEVAAVIAALDEAEVAFDAEQESHLPDSNADAIDLLDAEPILAEDEPLSGAADPVDIITRRTKNETPRDRITFYEAELAQEERPLRRAVLQHELATQLEATASDDEERTRAYAAVHLSDPTLRPTEWALRRLYTRKGQWSRVLELLDSAARHSPSKRERAELWTEKGHILEDLLGEVEEAIICYRTAHELDPQALAPLAALEKLLVQRGLETGRPTAELLTVYRGLTSATHDPGRRVALLIELARYEEDVLHLDQPGHSGDLERVLAYLHEAYDVGIDQMRVIDEIVRLTSSFGRIPDCLAALEVKAEILELQAQNASTQRQGLLLDQVVAIRRFQTTLARDRLGNGELAWQYLDKAHQRSPGDPLIMPDLLALAEAQGRHEQLADLLAQLEEGYRMVHGEDPPPLGLWLKRAVALRQAGQDPLADELEQHIATYTPTHLVLLVARQRRLLRQQDLKIIAQMLRDEATLAAQGLAATQDGVPVSDPTWAAEALLCASGFALRSGDVVLANECLTAAAQFIKASPPSTQQQDHQQLLHDTVEELLRRSGKWSELAAQYEQRLGNGLWASEPQEAQRLHESLIDLYELYQGSPERAIEMLAPLRAAMPDDLRLRRRQAQLSRRRGDAGQEAAELLEIERIEQQLGYGEPAVADLLRRAELLSQSGQAAAAVAIYEQVLRQLPGDPQALDAVEHVLRAAGKVAELAELLRRQVDAAQASLLVPSSGRSEAAERLLSLQAALADVLLHELGQPTEAAAVYRQMLSQRPDYYPAQLALERLYRRQSDSSKQLAVLAELAESLPSGAAKATVQVRLAEKLEADGQLSDADAAFARAFQSMPLPSPVAAHAALGRLRVLMQRRGYAALPELLAGFDDTLTSDDPLATAAGAVLREEQAYFSGLFGSGAGLERADTLLTKAGNELRQTAGAALPYPELLPLLELDRSRVSAQRSDGKQQGMALAALASQLSQQEDREDRPAVAELWLRAGLLGSLNEDEPGQQAEAARRLLQAYRLLGDVPQVVVPLCDLLADLSLSESLAGEPELIPLLHARQALCPPSEREDRILWTLTEAEIWLMRCESHDETAPVDPATRLHNAQQAAEAAVRALALDPQNIMALLLLRQATAPSPSELDPSAQPLAEGSPAATRLRTYGLYTLRLAELLGQPEAKAELYNEACEIFLHIGEPATAAAALRTLLDSTPEDSRAFGRLLGMLASRAEDPLLADAGPLLELLNFRLAQAPSDDAQRRQEQPQRVALLLQRANLLRSAGQTAEAIADLQSLIGLDSQHGVAHRRLAELLALDGRPGEAIHHYEQFLGSGSNPAERSAVHTAVARLLSTTAPLRAATHVRQAIDLGHKYRALRGDALASAEDVAALIDHYRWLEQLQLHQGQPEAAVATLRELDGHLPLGPGFSDQRQEVALAIAALLEEQKDRAGAIASLEKLLNSEPLAMKALHKLVELSQAADDRGRLATLYSRGVDEARRQIAAAADSHDPMVAAPFLSLAQIWGWQKQGDGQRLAGVAAMALGGPPEKPPTRKLPSKPLTAPLKTSAFTADARGVLYELWVEISESANKLLQPELKTLGSDAKERLNAKQVPAVWAAVDELAHKLGLGSSDRPYGLYMSRERDLCQISGLNLVCGSNYSSPLADLPPTLHFRLLRKLCLLPDHLGPVDGDPSELLLLFAACCQVIQLPGPTLSPELKSKLDERTKALDRTLARKERNAIRSLAAKLTHLAGDEGKDLVTSWQQEVQLGSAQLALTLGGNVAAALSDLKIGPSDSNQAAAELARRLLAFSVSTEILNMRRDFGVASE